MFTIVKNSIFTAKLLILLASGIKDITSDTHSVKITKENNIITNAGEAYNLLCNISSLNNGIELIACTYRTPYEELYSMFD